MKVIIAGGRDYNFNQKDFDLLDYIATKWQIVEVVSGCATGADAGGEQWAVIKKLPIKKFPANWKKYGKVAGPLRNAEMAAYADAVILFPGGKGTTNMFENAKEFNLDILFVREGRVFEHKYQKAEENIDNIK